MERSEEKRYAIEICDLVKFYGKKAGADGISLRVEEGDIFGFLGPNGAGKSTAIRCMLGILRSYEGEIRILSMDGRRQRREILSQVGYMPSEAMFYPSMKVKDVIRLAADARGRDCEKEAEKICARLEVNTEKRIRELSLGNRKKVSIVCAMQHKPRLLVLDEPTSGLDPLMQREFYAILEERNAQGAAIFLSSHVLSEVQRHCRHAAVIREGEILVVDSMEHLGKTRAKRVTLRGVDAPPALEGIRDVKKGGDAVNFLYSGSPEVLLNALAALPLTDVTITEPDLEEIFMHYYREGEK